MYVLRGLEMEKTVILDKILTAKREEVARLKQERPVEQMADLARRVAPTRDFAAAIRRGADGAIRLIAEFKRASPSKGVIRPDLPPADVARQYAAGGASAMSVLTDGPFFSGRLDDLRAVRAAVALPLLRKDFMIDPWQLFEARAAGADAILLIAAALAPERMAELHALANELGMAALVEVHDADDLRQALAVSARIIGINNRDLRTFQVEFETTLRLRPMIPAGTIVVSESGIQTRADALRLQGAGLDAMLVGESLMRQPAPGRAAAELLGG